MSPGELPAGAWCPSQLRLAAAPTPASSTDIVCERRSLAPSPTAPSPSASRRAKRSRLRVSLRRHQGDACALPPGLTRDPAQMARSGTDRRSSDRPGSRCSARAPLPPSPPPLRPFHQCVSCVRVYCLSRLYLRAASLLRGSGCPLTLRYICLAYRLKSSLTRSRTSNSLLSRCRLSRVVCARRL